MRGGREGRGPGREREGGLKMKVIGVLTDS